MSSDSSNIVITKFLSKYTTIDAFKNIINIALYPSDFVVSIGESRGNTVVEYIERYFKDLNKLSNQYNHDQKKITSLFIDAAKTILKLREAGRGLITYDTINQHFQSQSVAVTKLIQTAIDEKLNEPEEFREKVNQVVTTIDTFYDILNTTNGFTKIHEFLDKVSNQDISPIEAIDMYRQMAIQLNIDAAELSNSSKQDSTTDYYVLSDINSAGDIAHSIVDYIYDNYTFFNSGLNAFDHSVGGFESSSVHVLMAPSNGGKSVCLANLGYKLALTNLDDYEENDAALFVSCEDDLIKSVRKFTSIFGNFSYSEVRELYRTINEKFMEYKKKKNSHQTSEEVKENGFQVILKLLVKSIVDNTKNNIKIIFKYAPENKLCVGDIERQIEKFKLQKINIKYICIDYLDVLRPTSKYYTNSNDYDNLGTITQELRALSRLYGIPVLTATQTARSGDDEDINLTNNVMGDSIKKVRYSDFIYGIRIRSSLNIFSPGVAEKVFEQNSEYNQAEDPKILAIKDTLINKLQPMEFVVTKSKEQGKFYRCFMLFCNENLRLYNNVNEYLKDVHQLEQNNKYIEDLKTSILSDNNIEDDQIENTFDENYFTPY